MKSFESIEKEGITGLHFPKEDVLTEHNDIKNRAAELQRAMTLGNIEHLKMKIYFEDDVKSRVVDTAIWGVTDEKVILKKGTIIPIHRIYKLI